MSSAKEENLPATTSICIFRKGEMTYLVAHNDPMFQRMTSWSWNYERVGFQAWWTSDKEGVVPVYCFRKGEAALYCHSNWECWDDLASQGWNQEKIAFYAYASDNAPNGTIKVHE